MASYQALACMLLVALSLITINAETPKSDKVKKEVLNTAQAGYYSPGYAGYGGYGGYGYSAYGYKPYTSYPYNAAYSGHSGYAGYPYSAGYSAQPYVSGYPYNTYSSGYYPYNQYSRKGYYPYNTAHTQTYGYDDGQYYHEKYGGYY